MKKSIKQFLATAAFASIAIGAVAAAHHAHARYVNPTWEMRRTLNMAFGQNRIALEAPMGMCFLDESQYMEASVIKQLRTMSHDSGDGLLMAVFAECKEIEKFAQLPELVDYAKSMPGMDIPTANLDNRGVILWLAPKLGKAPLNLSEYLDMRDPTFSDETKKNLGKGFSKYGMTQSIKMADGVNANILSGAPDQYKFDEKAHRTDAGLSISYTSEFVTEYTPHKQYGAIGTTMLRNFPVQVTITEDGTGGAKSQDELHAMLDTYLAQISKLNP